MQTHYKTLSLARVSSEQFSSNTLSYALRVNLEECDTNIIFLRPFIHADTCFNVISCIFGQLLAEPWWIVELTACAVRSAVFTIPESVIWVQYTWVKVPSFPVWCTSFTEVVIANKRWYYTPKCMDICALHP